MATVQLPATGIAQRRPAGVLVYPRARAEEVPAERPEVRALRYCIGLIVAFAVVGVVALLVAFFAAGGGVAPGALAESAIVDGASYTSAGAYPVDARNPAQRAFLRGLGAGAIPGRGRVWMAVFITVSNQATAPRPAARRFLVVDGADRGTAPVPLPAANPFAYRLRAVPARAQLPPPGSLAADDLAAQGYLLLFSIPRSSAEGPLTLRVFDPLHPGARSDVLVLA